MRRRAVLLVALALVASGCLGLRTRGLDVTLENETEGVVEGTLTLKRASGEIVEQRAFAIGATSVHVEEDVTRSDGRYELNVTLEDGRSAQVSIVAGGAYGTPQVKIGKVNILIFQEEDLPPRSL